MKSKLIIAIIVLGMMAVASIAFLVGLVINLGGDDAAPVVIHTPTPAPATTPEITLETPVRQVSPEVGLSTFRVPFSHIEFQYPAHLIYDGWHSSDNKQIEYAFYDPDLDHEQTIYLSFLQDTVLNHAHGLFAEMTHDQRVQWLSEVPTANAERAGSNFLLIGTLQTAHGSGIYYLLDHQLGVFGIYGNESFVDTMGNPRLLTIETHFHDPIDNYGDSFVRLINSIEHTADLVADNQLDAIIVTPGPTPSPDPIPTPAQNITTGIVVLGRDLGQFFGFAANDIINVFGEPDFDDPHWITYSYLGHTSFALNSAGILNAIHINAWNNSIEIYGIMFDAFDSRASLISALGDPVREGWEDRAGPPYAMSWFIQYIEVIFYLSGDDNDSLVGMIEIRFE